jgi:hypothetical protein
MIGSAIHITPQGFSDGWASLQNECGMARTRLERACSAADIAEAWTALSAGRLTSFATTTLHRVQRLNRMTAAALLTLLDHGLIGDKDIHAYRLWRLVPYTDPARQVLSAVRADLELLREKVRSLGLNLRTQIGEPGSTLPRRLCLFFGLATTARGGARVELRRLPFKRRDVQTFTRLHFQGRPGNIGRHFFVSEMTAAGTDAWLIAAATGHGHVGAEVFSDSMGVAPALALARLGEVLESILAPLHLAPVPGAASGVLPARLAASASPNLATDPYLHPRRGDSGRILPPAADPLTPIALSIIGRVEAALCKSAAIPALGAGEVPMCLATLDGIHPSDLLEAQAATPDVLRTTAKVLTLAWRRTGCAGEILQPLCARTVLAIQLASSKESICSDVQMRAAGAWVRGECPEVLWPSDDRDVFIVYCALAQRWHRFQSAPAEMAAASRAIFSASANRESVLRLADPHRPTRFAAMPFVPVRTAISRERVKLRSALSELKRALGEQGNTRAKHGEEQKRSRALLKSIEAIDAAGDLPALRAKDVFREECRCWIDDDLRASGAGRQYSSLRTYGTQVFIGLELISATDDMLLWQAPDFESWFARVRSALRKPDDKEDPDMVGVRRFLLIGRDRLGWDVPDELLRGVSPFAMDGRRKAAAATLVYSFDYAIARKIVEERLAEWPLLLQAARIDLGLREAVPTRSGERATLDANCLTAESDRTIFRNAGYSDKKSGSGVRLCTIPTELAADIRQRAAAPGRAQSAFLFLDEDGSDWSTVDSIDRVENEALTLVTGDPSYRPHCGRAAAGCNIAWPRWEASASALFNGRGVSEMPMPPTTLEFNRVVRATMECGQGHAGTFLTYYASVWPFLRAISANARLRSYEPEEAFITQALGSTDAVRAARSRARLKGERVSAWDVITRVATERCGLPALQRLQPMPVLAAATTTAPTQDAIARYLLARTTGTPRDQAAQRFGIAISLANTLDTHLHGRKQ